MISVDDRLLSENVMLLLSEGFYNGIHLLIIGGIFVDGIGECLTMISHRMPMLSKDYANNIVRGVCLNFEGLLEIW